MVWVVSQSGVDFVQFQLDPAIWPDASPYEMVLSGQDFIIENGVVVAGVVDTMTFASLMQVDGTQQMVVLGTYGSGADVADILAIYPEDQSDLAVPFFASGAYYGAVLNDPTAGTFSAIGVGAEQVIANPWDDAFFAAGGVKTYAGDGDDTVRVSGQGGDVRGGLGRDKLYGDEGADFLSGNGGVDEIYGGAGQDALRGGRQSDSLYGGDGADVIGGGRGADHLDGGAEGDTLKGGVGADRLFGGDGADDILGQGGADVLFGGKGDDTIKGGAGRDVLISDGGADVLRGGVGADMFAFNVDQPGNASTHDQTGSARVLDFDLDEDVIRFGPHNNGAFTQADAIAMFDAALQDGADVLLEFGAVQIVFENVELDGFSADNFIGHPESGFYDWADMG